MTQACRVRESCDRGNMIPVLRCSICNGAQVAGFKNFHNGNFEEVCLICNDAELQEFKDRHGLTKITKEY